MANGEVTDYERGITPSPQPSIPKVALQEYVDTRFDALTEARRTAEQEREKSAKELRLGLQTALESGDDRLRDYVDAQLTAVRAARESADLLERERISLTHNEIISGMAAIRDLFDEKQKALDAALIAQKEAVAEAKVATDRIAIRSTTDQEGLRADMQERLAAVRRELEQATAAQKEAVLKAETANEKRFESVDEWKVAAAERERGQLEAQSKLVAQFMPREVSEAQNNEMRRLTDSHYKENQVRIGEVTTRMDKMSGQAEGQRSQRVETIEERTHQSQVTASQIATWAVIASVIMIAVVVGIHFIPTAIIASLVL